MKTVVSIFFGLILCSSNAQNSNNFEEIFFKFWMSTIEEQNKIPYNVRKLREEEFEGKLISLYKINSWMNIDFHVYVSEPIEEGLYETRIMFSPFGERDYSFDEVTKDYFMIDTNFIAVKVDNRGQGLSREVISNDRFILNGIKSKETYVYRGVFMDIVRAVYFVSEHKKSNGIIVAFGGSQGGMLTLVASALNKKINLAIARIPFFAGIEKYDKDNQWPMRWIMNTSMNERGISNKKQYEELSYYDVKNFAKLINIPIFIGSCENDPITPYEAILDAFVNIRNNDKMIYVVSPCNTHGYKSNIDQEISDIFLNRHLERIYKQKGVKKYY